MAPIQSGSTYNQGTDNGRTTGCNEVLPGRGGESGLRRALGPVLGGLEGFFPQKNKSCIEAHGGRASETDGNSNQRKHSAKNAFSVYVSLVYRDFIHMIVCDLQSVSLLWTWLPRRCSDQREDSYEM